MSAVDAVKARLESLIPSRTVYANAIPDGTLPTRYLVVYGNVGGEESSTMCDARDLRSPSIWVHSIARSDKPEVAAREAAWGAKAVRDALRGFRPSLGRVAWKAVAEVSQPPRRSESLPATAFYAVEQFSIQYQE